MNSLVEWILSLDSDLDFFSASCSFGVDAGSVIIVGVEFVVVDWILSFSVSLLWLDKA